jgi:hypothetical protein
LVHSLRIQPEEGSALLVLPIARAVVSVTLLWKYVTSDWDLGGDEPTHVACFAFVKCGLGGGGNDELGVNISVSEHGQPIKKPA